MLAQELTIYQDTEKLVILLIAVQKQMNRSLKHSIGDRMIGKSFDLFTHIYKINRETEAKRKVYHIEQFLYDFEIVKTAIRILEETREISTKTASRIAVLTNSIGKQANGWKRATS